MSRHLLKSSNQFKIITSTILLFFLIKTVYSQSNLIVEGKIGVGTEIIGKSLEVRGNLLTKSATTGGTAGAFAAEAGGLVSFWVNDNYNPLNHTSGWTRTLNLREGLIGIGTTDPYYPFHVNAKTYIRNTADEESSDFYDLLLGGFIGTIGAVDETFSAIEFISNNSVTISLDRDGNSTSRFEVINDQRHLALRLGEDGELEIAGSLSQGSDRNRKEQIEDLVYHEVLEGVKDMPIYEWQYKDQDRRHIGPMAQDFHKAFELGEDETTINAIDADGVALAAIKAQQEIIEEQKSDIDALKDKVGDLELMKAEISQMKREINELKKQSPRRKRIRK